MLPSEEKEKLIADFSAFVQGLAETSDSEVGGPSVDLFTLFQELTALKTEVKQESRLLKNALDNFKSVFVTLQEDNDFLRREIDQIRRREQQLVEQNNKAVLKPLLLDFVELRDRQELALGHMQTISPKAFLERFIWRSLASRLSSFTEGQAMILRRLDHILLNSGVHSMATVGKSFDPNCMKAMLTEYHPTKAEGVVLEELRKGFMWNNEVLRIAEVKVNVTIQHVVGNALFWPTLDEKPPQNAHIPRVCSAFSSFFRPNLSQTRAFFVHLGNVLNRHK